MNIKQALSILGINTTDRSVIKSAYRAKANQRHPDKHQGTTTAMQDLNVAYKMLMKVAEADARASNYGDFVNTAIENRNRHYRNTYDLNIDLAPGDHLVESRYLVSVMKDFITVRDLKNAGEWRKEIRCYTFDKSSSIWERLCDDFIDTLHWLQTVCDAITTVEIGDAAVKVNAKRLSAIVGGSNQNNIRLQLLSTGERVSMFYEAAKRYVPLKMSTYRFVSKIPKTFTAHSIVRLITNRQYSALQHKLTGTNNHLTDLDIIKSCIGNPVKDIYQSSDCLTFTAGTNTIKLTL
ncbi:J domain-containing protein [Vibrio barjaei]|uniref:J domain-containing protein n=1 Tax=Vibrio barjaei TaxID=1676683 RepID=UPI00228384DA|nr:J domain-containing protein [Vibrio barjaei]MCY9870385.1 J domain-containing protein [Vibrio barjaei]